MNLRKIIAILIIATIIITTINIVSAVNNITDKNQVVTADEDGCWNVSFSDGSKGYCIEYCQEEAVKGDKFYVKNTSYARNKYTGEDVSNYLKTYFIEHYDETQKDKVVTQHTIWYFTDDFDGWRVNKTLVDEIKKSPNKYNDNGELEMSNGTIMTYMFKVLLAEHDDHQNFFTYLIGFKEKTNDTDNETIDNETIDNETKPIDNETIDNQIEPDNETQTDDNKTTDENNTEIIDDDNNTIIGDNTTSNNISDDNKTAIPLFLDTGNQWGFLVFAVLIIVGILLIRRL